MRLDHYTGVSSLCSSSWLYCKSWQVAKREDKGTLQGSRSNSPFLVIMGCCLTEFSLQVLFLTEEIIPWNRVKVNRTIHFCLQHTVLPKSCPIVISYCTLDGVSERGWTVWCRSQCNIFWGFMFGLCTITDQLWTSAESERKSHVPLTQLCSHYSNNICRCFFCYFFL